MYRLRSPTYSKDLIEQYYDTSFTEFTDSVDVETELNDENDEIIEQVEDQLQREEILTTQVDEAVSALEQETQRNIKFQEEAEKNYKATKQVLIEMRIRSGEGEVESDFHDAFPFLPKTSTSPEIYTENSPIRNATNRTN